MPILHDAHVTAYYLAIYQACQDPGLDAYCNWLITHEAYEIF